MKRHLIIVLTLFSVLEFVAADPSEFKRIDNEYRHGKYDRIWKQHTAYIDRDGSIYIPVGEQLTNIDLKRFTVHLASLSKSKAVTRYNIYIHPEVSWAKIWKTISAASDSKIKIEWNQAELKVKTEN